MRAYPQRGFPGGARSAEPQPDVRIVAISSPTRNYAELIAEALGQQGLRCETCSIPFFSTRDFTPSMLRKLKAELRKSPPGTATIFCSGVAEYYLQGPHLGVHFSAYRRWFRPECMRVIAHPWTDVEPASTEGLKWTQKPPLAVGFMGTAYRNTRAARMVSRSALKHWLLSGHYLRTTSVLAALNAAKVPLKYAMTFPRAETFQILEAYAATSGMELQIVDSEGLFCSPEQNARYDQQMRQATYILCPRGVENYSFRFYEALKFGRVPVLVDTDMVLPEGVNWDELIVRVPYQQLPEIGTLIARDYEQNSAASFKRRQQKALEVMTKLCAGAWAEDLANDVRRQQLGQKAASFSYEPENSVAYAQTHRSV